MRLAGVRESLRERGHLCFLLPTRSEFKALMPSVGPSADGLDRDIANGTQISVPFDGLPPEPLRRGVYIEGPDGSIHRVLSARRDTSAGLLVMDCETSDRTEATP